MQACERRDQIGEALPLHDDVLAHPLRAQIGVAGDDRFDDAFVLVKRRRQTIAHPKLQAAIRPQAAMQRSRLLDEEPVVTAVVDLLVEQLVLVVIRIGIRRLCRALASAMRLEKVLVVEREDG